jgi:hypothetical protein
MARDRELMRDARSGGFTGIARDAGFVRDGKGGGWLERLGEGRMERDGTTHTHIQSARQHPSNITKA